jgi:integrase/recombinase XerD
MIDYVGDFVKYLEEEKKSKHTINGYEKALRDWAKFQFNKLPTKEQLEELKVKDFQRYKGEMKDKAPATQSKIISAIKSFYEYLRMFEEVENLHIGYFKCPKIPKKLPIYLTEAECEKLIKSVDKVSSEPYQDRNRAIIIMLINTGIRASELSNIKVSDIKDNKLIVNGKGNKERQLLLNDVCLSAIKKHLKSRLDNTKYLFASNRGEKISPNRLWQVITDHSRHIRMPKISPHKLRHTAATIWLNDGIELSVIKEILGHEALATTEIYAHVTSSQIEKAMARKK